MNNSDASRTDIHAAAAAITARLDRQFFSASLPPAGIHPAATATYTPPGFIKPGPWNPAYSVNDEPGLNSRLGPGGGDAAGEAADDEGGLGLLWLPYAVFTVVLLGLIAFSFARFHCQRGEQYRKRQEELDDKPTVAAAAVASGTAMNGRQGGPPLQTSPPLGGVAVVVDRDVPDHMSLFVQFTHAATGPNLPTKGTIALQRQRRLERQMSAVESRSNESGEGPLQGGPLGRGGGAAPRIRRSLVSASVDVIDERKGKKLLAAAQAKKNTKDSSATNSRPLSFTFNANGSMVDVRCSEDERVNTFRLQQQGSTASEEAASSSLIVAVTAPAATSSGPATLGLDGFRDVAYAAERVTPDRRCARSSRDQFAAGRNQNGRSAARTIIEEQDQMVSVTLDGGGGLPYQSAAMVRHQQLRVPEIEQQASPRTNNNGHSIDGVGYRRGVKRSKGGGSCSEDEALLQRYRPF